MRSWTWKVRWANGKREMKWFQMVENTQFENENKCFACCVCLNGAVMPDAISTACLCKFTFATQTIDVRWSAARPHWRALCNSSDEPEMFKLKLNGEEAHHHSGTTHMQIEMNSKWNQKNENIIQHAHQTRPNRRGTFSPFDVLCIVCCVQCACSVRISYQLLITELCDRTNEFICHPSSLFTCSLLKRSTHLF